MTIGSSAFFAHLLDRRELISYRQAHELLVGPMVGEWRNREHAVGVVERARVTPAQSVGGLLIQLDALVVQGRSREPGAGHFTRSEYGAATWRAAFAKWPLCQHRVEDVSDGS